MNKLAFLLLTPTLIAAGPPEPMTTVRTHYVYAVAAQACPKAQELRMTLKRDVLMPFLDKIVKGAHMTNEESNLLVWMCFLYQDGVRSGAANPALSDARS